MQAHPAANYMEVALGRLELGAAIFTGARVLYDVATHYTEQS
jgi:hypothetical protein